MASKSKFSTARGSAAVRRMADEFKAGVRHFDLHIGGSSSIVSGMLDKGILDPIEPWLALPEVKDPKQWWGGHLWVDNAKRFVYMFQAYLSEIIWYNIDLIKPNEIGSIRRFSQPEVERQDRLSRSAHAGGRRLHLVVHVAGQRRRVSQKTRRAGFISGPGSTHACRKFGQKGDVAVMIGLSYYSYLPFLKAGLPIKTLPQTQRGKKLTAPAAVAI